jgi:hypothetical protein
MITYNRNNLGEFKNEAGKYFTYRETSNEWALKNGLTHEIDTIAGPRYAKVRATVAHVATDEENGSAVTERWAIRNRRWN